MMESRVETRADTGLRAGYAKVDVTPTGPVMMGGYDLRGSASEGVHEGDHLYVRALVFADGKTAVAFIEADLILLRGVDIFRRRVSETTGIPFDHVLIGDTHNHAAPSPHPDGGTEWERLFADALLSAAATAASNLVPVRITAGAGKSRVGMNRRFRLPADSWSPTTFDENFCSQTFGKFATPNPKDILAPRGVVRLGANPEGPIDDEVQVVRVDRLDGSPLAALIHYACHGTSLGGRNTKVSGEWMGRMMAYVEDRVPGVGAIFVQGWALGEEIGAEVVRIHRNLGAVPPEDAFASTGPIEVRTREIRLPRTYRELFEDLAATAVSAPTTAVRLAGMMWVTFPGEMFHAIGQRVMVACPAAHAHVMGYTNGYIGYFPEQRAFAEGGYETAVSHLDPVAEQTYMREIAALMREFH
jgi:neutral ceramidase